MIITDYPCNLPGAVFSLPKMNKFKSSAILLTIFCMAKPVHPGLYCAIVFDRVDFHAAWHKLPVQSIIFSEIIFKGIEILLVKTKPALVMIEFKIFIKQRF